MLALIFGALLLNAAALFLVYGALMSIPTDLQAATAAIDANMDKVLAAFAAAQAGGLSAGDQEALQATLGSVHSIAGKIGQIINPPAPAAG